MKKGLSAEIEKTLRDFDAIGRHQGGDHCGICSGSCGAFPGDFADHDAGEAWAERLASLLREVMDDAHEPARSTATGAYVDRRVTAINPAHYRSDPSGVECIQITRYRNFDVGNAIKYLWRAGLKEESDKALIDKQCEDLEKAIWYIQDEIKRLRPS